jgi:hypothetical protein
MSGGFQLLNFRAPHGRSQAGEPAKLRILNFGTTGPQTFRNLLSLAALNFKLLYKRSQECWGAKL